MHSSYIPVPLDSSITCMAKAYLFIREKEGKTGKVTSE